MVEVNPRPEHPEQERADPAERPTAERPTADLLKDALGEAQHLMRLEIAIGREELRAEVAEAKRAGASFGAAASFALAGGVMLLVAIAAAFSMMWLAALVIGGALLAAAATLAALGWRETPKAPLGEARARLATDIASLRQRAVS